MEYAGFWRRYLASGIDGMIVSFLAFGLNAIVLLLILPVFSGAKGVSFQELLQSGGFESGVLMSLIYGVSFCVYFPYYVWPVYRSGATPGRKWMGIQIVSERGEMELSQAVIRFLSAFLSGLLIGAGYFMMLFHPRRKTLHDVIAGTVVIRASG
jgi:uncharacterized RDD family membrane protein YckC